MTIELPLRWAIAFAVATIGALAATALLRRIALATGFVDRPGPTKVHTHEIPYLGGIAIACAAIGCWIFDQGTEVRYVVVAAAAAGVAGIGLLDDRHHLAPGLRLSGEALAATAVVAAGVRGHPTGIEPLDAVITIVWIVGVTNAMNLLDNMDGLAAGTSFVVAGGVFALAVLVGQDALATAAAGLAGACLGFLVHNWHPASVFMGDAGALFLGFILSVAVLELRPEASRPGSFLVAILLLSLPVLDTGVVTFARLRNGRKVMRGGKDHLSHRLVRLGLSPRIAVAVLISAAVGTSALTALAGSGVVELWIAVGVEAAILGTLAIVAGRVRVYDEPPIGFTSLLRETPWRSRRPVPRPSLVGTVEAVPTTAAASVDPDDLEL